MKWFVVIKVFYVLWASFGPYESQAECQQHLEQMKAEGLARYESGERVSFMGKEVHPEYVRMTCKVK